MNTTDDLLEAFTKAVQGYKRTQLQMFQQDADKYAAKLISTHDIDPELLDDIYFEILDA